MLELRLGSFLPVWGLVIPKKEAAPKNKGCESHEKIMQQP